MDARSASTQSETKKPVTTEVQESIDTLSLSLKSIHASIKKQYEDCSEKSKAKLRAECYQAYYYLWRSLLSASIAGRLKLYKEDSQSEVKDVVYSELKTYNQTELIAFRNACIRFEVLRFADKLDAFQVAVNTVFCSDKHRLNNQSINKKTEEVQKKLISSFFETNDFFGLEEDDETYFQRVSHFAMMIEMMFLFERTARLYVLKGIKHHKIMDNESKGIYEKLYKDEGGIDYYDLFKRGDIGEGLLAVAAEKADHFDAFKKDFNAVFERYKKLCEKGILTNKALRKYVKELFPALEKLRAMYLSEEGYAQKIEAFIRLMVSRDEVVVSESEVKQVYQQALKKTYDERKKINLIGRMRSETELDRDIEAIISEMSEASPASTMRGAEEVRTVQGSGTKGKIKVGESKSSGSEAKSSTGGVTSNASEKKSSVKAIERRASVHPRMAKRESVPSRSQESESEDDESNSANHAGENSQFLRSRAPVVNPRRGMGLTLLKGLAIGLGVTGAIVLGVGLVFISHGAGLAVIGVFVGVSKAVTSAGLAWGIVGGILAFPPLLSLGLAYRHWKQKAAVLFASPSLPPAEQTSTRMIFEATEQRPGKARSAEGQSAKFEAKGGKSKSTSSRSQSTSSNTPTSSNEGEKEEENVQGYKHGISEPQGLPQDFVAVAAPGMKGGKSVVSIQAPQQTSSADKKQVENRVDSGSATLKRVPSLFRNNIIKEKDKPASFKRVMYRVFGCGSTVN